MRKMTCLVMDRSRPFTGFPIAAKKLEDISCTPFAMIMNRKIRMKRTAKVKYSSSPVPKREMICLGKNWNRTNPTAEIARLTQIASL